MVVAGPALAEAVRRWQQVCQQLMPPRPVPELFVHLLSFFG